MTKPENPPIICGTDFSGPAQAATDAALALAKRLGSPLRLIHATATPAEASAQERLEAEAQRLREGGADATAEAVQGIADEVLVQAAEEKRARLLIVSSLGQRVPSRWLLGSVAERTAEAAPVPTLVVRDAAPFQAWVRGERPLKVFVATDFTSSAEAALRWVAELRKLGPCEVTCGYANWPPSEASRLGTHLAFEFPGNPADVQRILERDLKAKVAPILGEVNVRFVVQGGWGRADAQLVAMAAEAEADVMVLGTHQRHGLIRVGKSSVSRGVLHLAPMSVVCVPTPDPEQMQVPRVREFRRVLVAVDLNEKYGFVAPYGYGVCQPGGTVHLVHVAAPFRLPNPMIGGYYQDYVTKKEHLDHLARCEERLRGLTPAEGEARGITTEVEIVESREIAHAICAAAERFNADAICIGSHNRPGFGAKMLGSVSLAVLQRSRRPVLVVWPPVP